MTRGTVAVLLGVLLAVPAGASEQKMKKPALSLRAAPRFAFSPASIRFTAELSGGDDVEEYYCPELEWEWDDGGKSVYEPDCEPFEPGKTKIERRFTAAHEYRAASTYNVKVSLRRIGKPFAFQTVRITVRPGAGDRSEIQDN